MRFIKNVVKTVAVVTVFSCVERFVGFLYRIFLSRELGAELLGIYQITLSVVGVLVTLTASGIPITVSRLMMKERASGNEKGEKDVISAGILSSLIISLPVTLLLYFGRGFFSFIFADQRCFDLLVIILPGVVITSVYAVIRGFFWGNCNFFTYSAIELIEEVVMCVSGVVLVRLSTSLWEGALSAAKSVFISYVTSFILSTAVFLFKNGKLTNPILKLRPLISSASPITAMRTLTSGLSSLVAIVIPARLVASGLSSGQAMEAFGEMSGMAMPLLFIPSTIIGSIALVIVPKLSESYYKKQRATLNEGIDRSIDCSVFISILIIPAFIASGREIGRFIYQNQNAGIYLSASAFIMLPMSITMITNSILNSLNKEKKTLLNFLIGAAAMLLVVWITPKKLGIYSLPTSYLVSYLLTGALNLSALAKITKNGKNYLKTVGKALLFGAVSTAFGLTLSGLTGGKTSDFLSILITAAGTLTFTILLSLITGALDLKKIFQK